MAHASNGQDLLYCFGCNERFRSSDLRGNCPRCGLPAEEVGLTEDGPTFLWKSADHWASRQPRAGEHQAADLTDLIGDRMGDYEINSLLGRGGMGYVFHARHVHLDRNSALKILAPELVSKDPDYLDRFIHEGQAMAAMQHPNIVSIYNIERVNGYQCLDMEYIPGRSLQQLIRDHRLPVERILFLGAEIARGLAEAHNQGILHRDLKPDNILMTLTGVPKIGDFGLAKRLTPGQQQQLLPAGTPHYMAPELFQGGQPTPATDVYALGVCLFQMLAGRVPFSQPGMNALIGVVTSQPPPSLRILRPDIPLEMAEIIHQMLDKVPENRPATGIEAAAMLDAVIGGLPDLQTLVNEAFEFEPTVLWKPVGATFELEVKLSRGRHQRLKIEATGGSARERILKISSLCCPAVPQYYEKALRLNDQITHGALMIHEIDGVPWFVMQNCYPRFTVDAEEVRRSVLEIGFHADAIEKELTGEDRN
jgi:hypothetical protein